jgi:aerobic carbon-monoxide dehydrogenase large subunit
MNAIPPNTAPKYIGKPILRKEDARLITGAGRYSDDFNMPGQLYAAMVRSPYASALIRGIDAEAALAMEGVIAVFSGKDIAAAGLRAIPHDHLWLGTPEQMRLSPDVCLLNSDGSPLRVPPHAILPETQSRFAGEAVAMVVAETSDLAKEAAALIDVDYEERPFLVAAAEAIEEGAPQLWPDIPNNICMDAEVGDRDATDAAFAIAPHVVELDTHIQRVTGVTMEPRCAVGSYDAETGRYQLYAGSSGVFRHKIELAHVLDVPPDAVRVLAHDVGGNFGTKNNFYPEYALVTWAAKELGRSVKWTSERQEAFMSDYQGRDLTVHAELALDEEGNFLGLRARNISNLGAYYASSQPLRKGVGLMPNVYRIPVAYVNAIAVVTNTVCTTPFRSAGRPEAIFVIERLIDVAAQRLGFDRIALRRRNLIEPDNFPFPNPLGLVYDNGDYGSTMDTALELIDWPGFEARAEGSKARGKRRGIGIANYVEITTGIPRERAEIRIDPDDGVELVIGTMSSGQGHETSFAQVTAEWLGVPLDKVRLTAGDTDRLIVGGGSISGRSMRFASVLIQKAVDQIIAQCSRVVAHLAGVTPEQVRFHDGVLRAGNGPTEMTVMDVARVIQTDARLPDDLKIPLYGEHDHLFREAGFPFGAQACEVEVDIETGVVSIVDIAAVDDVGKAINPLILHGQTIGGAVQGLGQALMEHFVYDPESGQVLSGSLMDYALPKAESMPNFKVALSEIPSPSNPMGIRAGGEGGTTPALAVLVNAVVDALKEFGVEHIEMPLTPQRVWRAIQAGQERIKASD